MANRFYNFPDDDREYVSVTTFLSIISKPFLYKWYAKMERELILLEGWEAYQKRDIKGPYGAELYVEATAGRGSTLHKAYDYTLKKLKLPKLSKAEKEEYNRWLEWWDEQNYNLLGAEQQVRSKLWGYAGTQDAKVGEHVSGQVKIIDWKTGKGPYMEQVYQNLAYQAAEKETGNEVDGGLLVFTRHKKIKTTVVPKVTDELLEPVLLALGLWRATNNKPKWEIR